MDNCVWKPSKKKYGVAICNFTTKVDNCSCTLALHVGDTVHILEEYGSGPTGWYRGSLLSDTEKKGIFPACLIHIKLCDVENEGLYETISPVEDPVVKELTYVLREWNVIREQLYVKRNHLMESITVTMLELMALRSQLINNNLTHDEARDITQEIVRFIDWGNGHLGMDLVPRIDGEQVEADTCSITRLYRVHEESAIIARAEKPKPRSGNKSTVSSKEMSDTGVIPHHLLVSFKNFGCNVGDTTETLLSLYQLKDLKCICLTEKFLLRHDKHSAPSDIDKLNSYYGLFTDLTTDDLERDLYLVAQIYRIGRMSPPDNSKKVPTVTYKRPWGVGVLSLSLSKLPATFKDYEFPMKVQCCEENEGLFPMLHERLIKSLAAGGGGGGGGILGNNPSKIGPGLTISTRTLHGHLPMVKKEDPLLFSKGVALVQKLGFSEIITPAEVRNDLYIILKSGEFDRGSKKSQKNMEINVTVFDANGKRIDDCITYGCGESPSSVYKSSIFYHNNRPEWNESIRLSVPIEVFPDSHILFELFHCSVHKREVKKPVGFAFVKVTNEAQIVIQDNVHRLCVYKVDEKHKLDSKKYLDLPFLLDDLNDPQNFANNRVPSRLQFRANERESLTISTLLCSGKFTQCGDLLGVLNWRGDQFRERLSENLDKLGRMDGEEIVKFLHDILDSLFDMLDAGSSTSNLSQKIFRSMVHIFTLIHHARFETFQPVLEAYISNIFSAALIHRPLIMCFCDEIQTVCQSEGKGNFKLIQVFQAMDYILRFVVRSRELQLKNVYTSCAGDAAEFEENLRQLFDNMGILLSSTLDNLKSYQMTLLGSLYMVYQPLLRVLSEQVLCNLVVLALNRMPKVTELPVDIVKAKLKLMGKTVETKLFINDDSRNILLSMFLGQVKQCLQDKVQLKLTVGLLGDICDMVYNLKQTVSIQHDIHSIVSAAFDVVMTTVLAVGSRQNPTKGALISCLTEMLRLMDEGHYNSIINIHHRGLSLTAFLSQILSVFNELVQPDVFPTDWTVMRMITNNVVFTATEYFSQALRKNYIKGPDFDLELWSQYFHLAVAFITQPCLQLNRYSQAKAQKTKERYQDMRLLMAIQVETLWQSLGGQKEHFIPSMVGPFLELTLVQERDVRKATLPIIFDMIETEMKKYGNFKQVEAALIERLDFFITTHSGDTEYKDLFNSILLERVQSEPCLQENGSQFIISITHLLERLLDYRQIIDGDDNRDKRMHCTFNILNFYKDDINREEMYIRYVSKLYELHMAAANYSEAGLTLQLYTKLLRWSDDLLPAELQYPEELEWVRKEKLYYDILSCFDKGKVWEYGIPLCKDLANFYEKKLDYRKLGDILKQQASFYQKILEGVPGVDPSFLIPRQDPTYYRVAYYGQGFPAFVRNKQFIYRGDECLKLGTMINHLTLEFPAAQIIPNKPHNEAIEDSQQQYIKICNVKPVPADRADFEGKDVPTAIQNFYNGNEVDTFQLDQSYHRGEMNRDNEIESLCLERTKLKTCYKFPGILRWYEVVSMEVEMFCPIRVAIEATKQSNSMLETLIDQCQVNPKLYFRNLEMRLQGTISAAVNGGITKYHEAFFSTEFESKHPAEVIFLDDLKRLFQEQTQILTVGMKMHERLVTEELQPLHNNLEVDFGKMRRAVNKHGSRNSVAISISSGDSESRSSMYSLDEDPKTSQEGVRFGEGPLYEYLPTIQELGSHEKPHHSLSSLAVDGPPPIPSRPRSMLLGEKQSIDGKKRQGSDPMLIKRTFGSVGNIMDTPSRKAVSRIQSFSPATPPLVPQRRRPSDEDSSAHRISDPERHHQSGPISPTSPTLLTPFRDLSETLEPENGIQEDEVDEVDAHGPPAVPIKKTASRQLAANNPLQTVSGRLSSGSQQPSPVVNPLRSTVGTPGAGNREPGKLPTLPPKKSPMTPTSGNGSSLTSLDGQNVTDPDRSSVTPPLPGKQKSRPAPGGRRHHTVVGVGFIPGQSTPTESPRAGPPPVPRRTHSQRDSVPPLVPARSPRDDSWSNPSTNL